MLILAIDTAGSAVTAGLVRLPADGPLEVLAERATVNARAHAELLTPSVQEVLAETGSTFADLDAIVCGAGPGPFTGLRVGMVSAAAFGDALQIPVYPVGSLDAIAVQCGPGGDLLVVTDARRREVYWARYDTHGSRVAGPEVRKPAEVPVEGVERVAGTGGGGWAPGDWKLPVVGPPNAGPLGLVTVAQAALRAGDPPGDLVPFYLRRPDAVEPGRPKAVSPTNGR